MTESEKKSINEEEELEEVNGGDIIEDAMEFVDDMSIGDSSCRVVYYIKNLRTGAMIGPFAANKIHLRRVLKEDFERHNIPYAVEKRLMPK